MAGITRFERWWLNAWPHRLHVRRFVPRFLKASPDPFRGEVLEVGAGSGWTSQRILETFPQVELTATDVDQTGQPMVEKLRETYGQRLNWQQADLLKLPFDRAAFDFVLAIHVLHHIGDLNSAIGQLLRVLRPGGLIGISDKSSAFNARPNRQMIEGLLKEEGCDVLKVSGDMNYYVWARKPYQ